MLYGLFYSLIVVKYILKLFNNFRIIRFINNFQLNIYILKKLIGMNDWALKRLVERVYDAILNHREDIPGKDTSSPHLYHNRITKNDDGSYTVSFWSEQGFFHDCWIDAYISRDGIITFNHCGCDGMKKLVKLVREELSEF